MKGAAGDGFRYPEVDNQAGFALTQALRLAKAGWFGGDPEKVLEAPGDIVLAILQYETFSAQYERRFIEINRER